MKVMNKTTQAVFQMDTMTASEILKKYHFIEVVEATVKEKKEIAKINADPQEIAILSGEAKIEDAGLADVDDSKVQNESVDNLGDE